MVMGFEIGELSLGWVVGEEGVIGFTSAAIKLNCNKR